MSERKTSDIANLFAVLYWNKCKDTFVGLFGDRLIDANLSRSVKTVFDNGRTIIDQSCREMQARATETGTFDYMEYLIKSKTIVNRIIIFSDCQVGDGRQLSTIISKGIGEKTSTAFSRKYLIINPDVSVYTVDLRGYGNSMTKDNGNVILVSGWSEKIFDMIYLYRNKLPRSSDVK